MFLDFMSALGERGRSLIGRRDAVPLDPAALLDRCDVLLSGRGEASGTALATLILASYETFDPEEKAQFFQNLLDRFGSDREKLAALVREWLDDPSEARTGDLHFLSEPPRQELFRRLNRAPGGTHAIVHMRADLLKALKSDPMLAPVDRDLSHLLGSWFNRGFLILRRIDWSTPAIVLEKIIQYEAVHEIVDFPSLRLRIDPPDRRCYGFFHPALPDEPLIFVEVALANGIPGSIQNVLSSDRTPVVPTSAKAAVFYSISNCQKGLAGISFGNFLIKQVVEELRREFARLEQFVTLSPMPGFRRWLTSGADLSGLSVENRQLLARLETDNWAEEQETRDRLRKLVEPLGAAYLAVAKRPNGRPLDPVAGFHLGNGARLERLNWLADVSDKGLKESAGLMVNYLYDLDSIEKNHEAFVNDMEIVMSSEVRKLLKSDLRPKAADSR